MCNREGIVSSRKRTFLGAVLGAALLVAVTLWTYGFSLGLPLFLDDMVHFRWLAWHDLAGIWTTSRLLGYYRPLPFTLWKALWLLQGRYEPLVLHAVNLTLHTLNSILVMVLVASRSNTRRLATAVAAALLFALFPFSYQAVPWVGSLTHPLVTGLILASLVLYQASQRPLRRRGAEAGPATDAKPHARLLKGASLALALLAPFAHETGVLVAPLLFLLLLTDEEPLPWRQAMREAAPYAACAAFGLAVWLLVPKGVKGVGIWDAESRLQNAIYFLQALAYPVTPLATRLTGRGKPLSDLAAVAMVGGPAVLAWAFLAWKARRGKLLALALGWFVLCAAPAWAVLRFAYVIDGPRLLYEAAVGAAVFWAIPLDLRPSSRVSGVAATALGAVAVTWAAWSGYTFIRARVPIYEQMRLAVEELQEVGGGMAGPLICINFPSWFAPLQATYALGHEGMALVPDYTSVADLWWLHTGQEREITSVTLPDLQSHWRYHYVAAGPIETAESLQPKLRTARRVIVTRYDGPNVAVYDAGGLVATGQGAAQSFAASFDGTLALLSATSRRQGAVLRVELYWQCWQPVVHDTTVFLHVYDGSGQLVAQGDGYPLMGAARLTAWQAGDEWRDVRLVSLPQGLATGEYTVKVGLYPSDGGARVPATNRAGVRFQDDAVPLGTLSLP